MKQPLYAYKFKISVEKTETGFVAFCPGVHGVYEEGATKEEAIENAYLSACAILDARAMRGDWLVEENESLRIIRTIPRVSEVSSTPGEEQEYLKTVTCG